MFALVNGYVLHLGLAIIVFFLAAAHPVHQGPCRPVLAVTAQQRDLRHQHHHAGLADRRPGDALCQPGATHHFDV